MSADNTADDLICATEAAGLSLATGAGMETWAKGMLRSTLDLVFTSPWITNRLLQSQRQNCWHTGSNHFPITTEVDIEASEGPPPSRRLLWKKADWKVVQSELEGRLQPLHSFLCDTRDKLNALVEAIHQAIENT